jgi:hypothetical protein
MTIRIYTLTHKKFTVPKDEMYVPLQVGKAGKPDLGYIGDDTGDNISNLNCYYSELTGVYWIWKNVHDVDYVGVCHYRRYLLNELDLVLTKDEILMLLSRYDLLTSKCITLDNSYYYGFSDNHNIRDLDETGNVIKMLYPAYYDTFIRLVHGNRTYFGNICIMKKSLYDEYCSWLFPIFQKLHERIEIDSYDSYHKRVYGFISEFLLYVWVTYRGLLAYECKVGLIGEKVETKELKSQIAKYLLSKDVSGAKEYFMAFLKERPDVLMEASDITGDLRICMQIIATADAENKGLCQNKVLNRHLDLTSLIRQFKVLNSIIIRYNNGLATAEEIEELRKLDFSKTAFEISLLAHCKYKSLAEQKLKELLVQLNNNKI